MLKTNDNKSRKNGHGFEQISSIRTFEDNVSIGSNRFILITSYLNYIKYNILTVCRVLLVKLFLTRYLV